MRFCFTREFSMLRSALNALFIVVFAMSSTAHGKIDAIDECETLLLNKKEWSPEVVIEVIQALHKNGVSLNAANLRDHKSEVFKSTVIGVLGFECDSLTLMKQAFLFFSGWKKAIAAAEVEDVRQRGGKKKFWTEEKITALINELRILGYSLQRNKVATLKLSEITSLSQKTPGNSYSGESFVRTAINAFGSWEAAVASASTPTALTEDLLKLPRIQLTLDEFLGVIRLLRQKHIVLLENDIKTDDRPKVAAVIEGYLGRACSPQDLYDNSHLYFDNWTNAVKTALQEKPESEPRSTKPEQTPKQETVTKPASTTSLSATERSRAVQRTLISLDPLISKIAARFSRYSMESSKEDVYQEAYIAAAEWLSRNEIPKDQNDTALIQLAIEDHLRNYLDFEKSRKVYGRVDEHFSTPEKHRNNTEAGIDNNRDQTLIDTFIEEWKLGDRTFDYVEMEMLQRYILVDDPEPISDISRDLGIPVRDLKQIESTLRKSLGDHFTSIKNPYSQILKDSKKAQDLSFTPLDTPELLEIEKIGGELAQSGKFKDIVLTEDEHYIFKEWIFTPSPHAPEQIFEPLSLSHTAFNVLERSVIYKIAKHFRQNNAILKNNVLTLRPTLRYVSIFSPPHAREKIQDILKTGTLGAEILSNYELGVLRHQILTSEPKTKKWLELHGFVATNAESINPTKTMYGLARRLMKELNKPTF